jgi:hypothetical protein
LDEEIDIKFGETAFLDVGFGAVYNKIPLEMTANEALEIGDACEVVVVII